MKRDDSLFEQHFFEKIVQERPKYVHALSVLAEIYTARKLYRKGLALDKRLAKLCPGDGVVFYNLACSFALVGEPEKAIDALEKSVELGYSDWQHMLNDSDLKTLHEDPRFKKWLKGYKLTEKHEA